MAINRPRNKPSRLPRNISERIPLYAKDLSHLCGCKDFTGITLSALNNTLLFIEDRCIGPKSLVIITIETDNNFVSLLANIFKLEKGKASINLWNVDVGAGGANLIATDKLKLHYTVFNN